MTPLRSAVALLPLLAVGSALAETPPWLRPPQLAVMTGFIKDPPNPQTIEDWQQGLGSQFDAGAWVRAFKDSGAAYLIFYDKWIDGLVFHDTKTTGFKTKRDFLREIADACHAQQLPLVIYWNAAYDNNPEFAEYATLDQDGHPIRFPEPWPCRLLSMHSPFREKSLEQVRETVGNYRPIAGLWLDCYGQPWPTTDRYTTAAFEARYHKTPAEAPELASPFVQDTLVDYVKDLRKIAAELQPDLTLTYNGSQTVPMGAPASAISLTARMDFLSTEGHSFPAMDSEAAPASFLRRPMETGDLLSGSWFAPPPPTGPERARRAVAEAAVAWCQGANVYLALSPTHEGTFGPEAAALKACGDWLRPRQKLLAESTPWPDVGIVLGAPAPDMPGFPGLAELWGSPVKGELGAWGEAQRLCRRLTDRGYSAQVLYALGDLAAWPEKLSEFGGLVLPERACLDADHLAKVREYVRGGGRLLAFGHASLLDDHGKPAADFALADVLGLHYVGPARFPPGAGPAVCYADSEYSPEWSKENLADGTSAGWASADTPMPHWAQVNLPAEAPVAKVRVTGRQGSYMLRDFEVLTWNGAGWDSVRKYAGNTERIVECPIEPPRTTLGVRVVVTAETYEGQERRLADIEELELFGPDGKLLSHAAAYPLTVHPIPPITGLAEDRRPREEARGPAVIAETRGANVMSTFDGPAGDGEHPFVTVHRFGEGSSLWSARGEASVVEDPERWTIAAAICGGTPLVLQGPPGRHRVILRRAARGLLICAIDTQPDAPPQALHLRVQTARMGLKGTVDPALDGRTAAATRSEAGLAIEVTPDPAATLLIR